MHSLSNGGGIGRRICAGLLLVMLETRCSQAPLEKSERPVTTIFQGFVYVGDRPLGSRDEHYATSRALPASFNSDREFIFHHQLPVDVMKMARETLPSRLQDLGFLVSSTPDAAGRGVFVFSNGEAAYMLKAERGTCAIEIDHEPDRRLLTKNLPWEKGRWEYSDYILKVHGGCDI
jgi:hypothetical protein